MKISEIKNILRSYDVITNALLFGSHADNTQHAMSDIDIAVITKNEMDIFTMGEIISKLEAITGSKIDLVSLNDLYKKSPLLAYNIYQNHKIIFLRDEQNEAFSQRIADGDLAKIKTA